MRLRVLFYAAYLTNTVTNNVPCKNTLLVYSLEIPHRHPHVFKLPGILKLFVCSNPSERLDKNCNHVSHTDTADA